MEGCSSSCPFMGCDYTGTVHLDLAAHMSVCSMRYVLPCAGCGTPLTLSSRAEHECFTEPLGKWPWIKRSSYSRNRQAEKGKQFDHWPSALIAEYHSKELRRWNLEAPQALLACLVCGGGLR